MSSAGSISYGSPWRRRVGRAASPPTMLCYEQHFAYEDDFTDSASDSCSEDDEHYPPRMEGRHDSEGSDDRPGSKRTQDESDDMDMDMGEEDADDEARARAIREAKGKQRAVDPVTEPSPRRRRPRPREPIQTLRPILTIHKSQGFVWNQDLFIPGYMKDRYIASTSPPGAGFISSSVSSSTSAINDYEVEVVEIRVRDDELKRIIP
ncbi:hypothetical protein BD626DRAFT_489508 [Schizophyllum amplum]|uniref:Uncharacterized protein n=1 Tax=Schizophyllum amplum TaxID=97359 RepID=A0A550CIV5_9AGAR|nr:hypothetical protein BD626DRAFT_489508 [Auriculariopsis ampla]